jgi:hypothetical protein
MWVGQNKKVRKSVSAMELSAYGYLSEFALERALILRESNMRPVTLTSLTLPLISFKCKANIEHDGKEKTSRKEESPKE